MTARICAALAPRALAQWRNRRVGFIFQAYHLLPELSALENVMLARPHGARVGPAEAARRAATTAGTGRLGPARWNTGLTNCPAANSSAWPSPARWSTRRTSILADEPTGNLDSHTGEEIIQLLEALRAERQGTLVMATHDARIAARAPRVLELADGQLVE